MFSELRPVGNRITLAASPLDRKLFFPYSFIGCGSGTEALALSLQAIRDAKPQIEYPEVLIPAYTCPDIISACLYANVKPILVDFETNQPWMDLKDLSLKLSDSCIAIVAINFLGIPERIEKIRSCFNSGRVTIIEDSAQGLPKESPEKYWSGDIIITSFGRGKPLNLIGGGGIFYNSSKISKELLDHLNTITESLVPDAPNMISKVIYTIKVGLFNLISFPFFYYLLSKLPYLNLGATIFHPLDTVEMLPKYIEEQLNRNYRKYANRASLRSKFDDVFHKLNSSTFISLPIQTKLPQNFPLLRYPILILNKEIRVALYNELQEKGLGASTMYQKTLPNITGVKNSMIGQIICYPNAENLALSLVTLPMHEDIDDISFEKIQEVFLKYV